MQTTTHPPLFSLRLDPCWNIFCIGSLGRGLGIKLKFRCAPNNRFWPAT